MKRLILIVGLFFVMLSVPILCEATPVTIDNFGFEEPAFPDAPYQWTYDDIPDWSKSVGGLSGVYRVSTFPGRYSDGAPEGVNVAFINRGSIFQELEYQIRPDTDLHLKVDVGWYSGIEMPEYEILLGTWAEGGAEGSEHIYNIFASGSSDLTIGQFVTSELSYHVGASNPLVGENLMIMLSYTGESQNVGESQINFDKLSLTNADAVPEPSTMFLLGSGLLGLGRFIRRKKKG